MNLIFYSNSISGKMLAQKYELKKVMTVDEVFKYIKQNTNYSVFYQTDNIDLNRKIKINLAQSTTSNLLQQTFKSTKLSYKYVDDYIVIVAQQKIKQSKQTHTVKGTITADDGELLPGVVVIIKGTSTGVISDFDGIYEINVENLNDTLVFSFIGFKKKIEPINERTEINIVLESDTKDLDEVVVIGYATQKKSSVTGSISTIDADDLTKTNALGISQAMQGLAAGINVTQNSGAPGEGVQVQIRGLGSVTGVNSPLYIIDGVPTKDGMNNLSTSDIKSISVLKDASSAAIYGSRASNGVVLITTFRVCNFYHYF